MKCPFCKRAQPVQAFDDTLPDMEPVLFRGSEPCAWICRIHGVMQDGGADE